MSSSSSIQIIALHDYLTYYRHYRIIPCVSLAWKISVSIFLKNYIPYNMVFIWTAAIPGMSGQGYWDLWLAQSNKRPGPLHSTQTAPWLPVLVYWLGDRLELPQWTSAGKWIFHGHFSQVPSWQQHNQRKDYFFICSWTNVYKYIMLNNYTCWPICWPILRDHFENELEETTYSVM